MKVRGMDQKEHNLKPEQIWWKQEVQTNGKIIYTVGHGASLENGKLIIKGSAAVFVEE